MKGDYDRLEGTYKLAGLKRLERFAYIIQSMGIIATFIFLVYIRGAMLNPFYLPIFWAISAALIWLFILSLEAIFFRLIEINKRESESAKFLMADRSMKKAFTIIVITLIAFAAAFVPFFSEQVEDINRYEGESGLDHIHTIEFTSRGRFDFLRADKINIEIVGGGDFTEGDRADVYIIPERIYDPGRTGYGAGDRLNLETEFGLGDDFNFQIPDISFEEYIIVIISDEMNRVQYEVGYIIPDHITNILSTVFMAFVIAQTAWAIALHPIKKKHSEQAIYK
ncbi:MAG: hypothetical protein ACOC53_05875 [Candidatus Saliniplasma sp.]